MTNDEIIDAMTSHACDIFFEGTKRVASNEEFEAMRDVMVPIAIHIKDLEDEIAHQKYLLVDLKYRHEREMKAKK